MIYPSIDKLLNVVDSKYRLVHLAALRSDDIRENNNLQKNEEDYVSKKNIGRALEEVADNLIIIKQPEEKKITRKDYFFCAISFVFFQIIIIIRKPS